jgi:hypothetical protein
MTRKISILFYGKKSRITKDNMVPIDIRITVNRIRVYDCSTSKLVEVTKWSPAAGKVKGNSEEARIINNYPDARQTTLNTRSLLGNPAMYGDSAGPGSFSNNTSF